MGKVLPTSRETIGSGAMETKGETPETFDGDAKGCEKGTKRQSTNNKSVAPKAIIAPNGVYRNAVEIVTERIGDTEIKVADARELHRAICVAEGFHTWFYRVTRLAGLKKGVDYEVFEFFRKSKRYVIALSEAKRIANKMRRNPRRHADTSAYEKDGFLMIVVKFLIKQDDGKTRANRNGGENNKAFAQTKSDEGKAGSPESLLVATPRFIAGKTRLTINARDLHKALEIRQQFGLWLRYQTARAKLWENIDLVKTNGLSFDGKRITDYFLTLSAAELLAAISGSRKSELVRGFIREIIERGEAFNQSDFGLISGPDAKSDSVWDRLSNVSVRVRGYESEGFSGDKEADRASSNDNEALKRRAIVNQTIPFSFEGNPLRAIHEGDKVYFVAKDAAIMLDYANPRQAIIQHCKNAITAGSLISRPPLDPQTVLIKEADLWRLIIKSTKPEAQKIELWVMEEVLPSIHKTGSSSLESGANAYEGFASFNGESHNAVSGVASLQLFEKHGFKVRGGVDESGKPYLVAKDICECLGIEWKGSDSIGYLDKDEIGSLIVKSSGGKQKTIVVYESGFYALVFKSRKEEAKIFRKWVTSEVLPSIHKTGSYQMPLRDKRDNNDDSLKLTINGVEVELIAKEDQVWATSLDIAKVFEKRHDNVIRDIKALPQDEFNELNFKLVTYQDRFGDDRKRYYVSRDGFVCLDLGKGSHQWKIAFIEGFSRLERMVMESRCVEASWKQGQTEQPSAYSFAEGLSSPEQIASLLSDGMKYRKLALDGMQGRREIKRHFNVLANFASNAVKEIERIEGFEAIEAKGNYDE
jgi:Rha family phage regulatory protein